MQNIDQLIEQARALMTCPACGRHYDAKEITFKGLMDHTYILQTTCSNSHATIFTTWITSYAPALTEEIGPLEHDHVLAMHDALKAFDGDFKKLWSKKGKQ